MICKAAQSDPEVAADGRQVRYCISTADVDRDNDIIDQRGWDFAAYRRNPVVLWAHSHTELPIGKCVALGVEGGRTMATVEFAMHSFAESVYQLVKRGFLKATSVGFRALEAYANPARGGTDFKRQELLEFSIVPVPANPSALQAAAAAGIDTKLLRKWARAILEKSDDEPVLALADSADDVVIELADDAEPTIDFTREQVTREIVRLFPDLLRRGTHDAIAAAFAGDPAAARAKRADDQVSADVVREAVARGFRQARGRLD